MSTWLENAVEQWDKARYKDGDLVSHDWMKFALLIPSPSQDLSATDVQFMVLTRVEALKQYLLNERKIAMESIRGRGYRVVPPEEQASFAVDEGLRFIRKGLGRANSILTNTRVEQLTNEEAARHTDMQIKMAGLAQMLGRQKKDILAMVTPALK